MLGFIFIGAIVTVYLFYILFKEIGVIGGKHNNKPQEDIVLTHSPTVTSEQRAAEKLEHQKQKETQKQIQQWQMLIQSADKSVQKKDFQSAKNYLLRAWDSEQNSDIAMRLGFVLQQLSEFKTAQEIYLKAIIKDRNNDLLHLNIAKCYEVLEDYESAKHHYIEALKLDNTFDKTHLAYGEFLKKTGQEQLGEEHLQKAQDLQKS